MLSCSLLRGALYKCAPSNQRPLVHACTQHFFAEERPRRASSKSSRDKPPAPPRFPPKEVFTPPAVTQLPIAFPHLTKADVVVQATPSERVDMRRVQEVFTLLATCTALTDLSVMLEVKAEHEVVDMDRSQRTASKMAGDVVSKMVAAGPPPNLTSLHLQVLWCCFSHRQG